MTRDTEAALLDEARRQLARVPALLDTLIGDMEPATARTRPEGHGQGQPDEWSPVEIACHLRDEETEDFGALLHAAVEGRREGTPIIPLEWVESRRYRDADLKQVLAVFRQRREESLAFLAGLRPEQLAEWVEHPAFGRFSAEDVLAAWVAHDRLHLAQLAATLARLWADRWPGLPVDYAGPIPYPTANVAAPSSGAAAG